MQFALHHLVLHHAPRRVLFAVAAALLFSVAAQAQITFQINSLGDAGKGGAAASGQCWTGSAINGQLECTLRAAIQAANQRSELVTFEFADIPVGSNHSSFITIGSALPTIVSQVHIRGQSHPEWFEGRANVRIQGSANGVIQSYGGLVFGPGSDNSQVENIGIRFVNDAVTIAGASSITINNNYLAGGRSNADDSGRNGRYGILLSNAHTATILGNFIRGNNSHGIVLVDGSSGNVISGNYFGVRPAGSTFAPFADSSNGGAGIYVHATAGTENSLGVVAGNYFANNDEGAIQVFADGQLISANRIGLPPVEGVYSGYAAADYGNRGDAAIHLESDNNEIFSGNLIGNADQVGIRLGSSSTPAYDNEIYNNRIGLDNDDQPFGMRYGIELVNSSNTLIRGNTIANHSIDGIYARINGHVSQIRSNQIMNNSESGVHIRGSARIGSDSLSDANLIGGNKRGVLVHSNTGLVEIWNNYIGTNPEAEDLGNETGIQVQNNTGFVDIGKLGNGNIIGNNSALGIYLATDANKVWVMSNQIGVHPDGTAIGNGTGIRISGNGAAYQNLIGYSSADTLPNPVDWLNDLGQGNTIANSSGRGILITGNEQAVDNNMRGNRFFANQGRDIDLGMNMIDPGGGTSGPNTRLNWPEFDAEQTWLDLSTGEAQVAFSVNTFPTNASYPLKVDLYLIDDNNPTRPAYIRTIEYPHTAGSSNQVHIENFSWPTGLPFSGHLVATASDGVHGNTSQFSAIPVALDTSSDGLGTVMPNNGWGGVYLDLQTLAGNSVVVSGFDLAFNGSVGSNVDVAVYVRDGSYVGEEQNESAWTLHETLTYQQAGVDAFASATLNQVIEIEPGQVQGVYLQALSADGIRYSGTNARPPQTDWNDGTLSLFSDTATTANAPFDGDLYQPRSFAGIVRYDAIVEDGLFSDRFEN